MEEEYLNLDVLFSGQVLIAKTIVNNAITTCVTKNMRN